MTIQQNLIRSLIVPFGAADSLLLPSAIVVEVAHYHQHIPEKVSDSSPEWFVGITKWRGQNLPVLSMEAIFSLPTTALTKNHRIVVLYGLESPQHLPFYAFISSNIPRMLPIGEETFNQYVEEKREGLVFTAQTTIDDKAESLLLPDLTYLENLLRKTGLITHF